MALVTGLGDRNRLDCVYASITPQAHLSLQKVRIASKAKAVD